MKRKTGKLTGPMIPASLVDQIDPGPLSSTVNIGGEITTIGSSSKFEIRKILKINFYD